MNKADVYDNVENIDDLFEKWINRQEKNPDGYEVEKTGIALNSFTRDGIVDIDTWNEMKNAKVLYILREANGLTYTNNAKTGGVRVDGNQFWFRNCVQNAIKGNKDLNTAIFKKVKLMQGVIEGKEPHMDLLKHIAYMNLNKRGGSSTVNWEIFNNYAINYRDEIKKEISLINPQIIICCGTYWTLIDQVYQKYTPDSWNKDNDYVYKLKINENEVKVVNMWHPSCRKSNEEYKNAFENRYNEIEKGKSLDDLKEIIKGKINRLNNKSQLEEILSNIDS